MFPFQMFFFYWDWKSLVWGVLYGVCSAAFLWKGKLLYVHQKEQAEQKAKEQDEHFRPDWNRTTVKARKIYFYHMRGAMPRGKMECPSCESRSSVVWILWSLIIRALSILVLHQDPYGGTRKWRVWWVAVVGGWCFNVPVIEGNTEIWKTF